MNLWLGWLSLPLSVRCTLLFVLGAVVGGQINRGIYRLAWYRRSIGPWSRGPQDGPRRSAFDRIPIFGWLGLRREAALHASGFWIRPMLIELATGLVFALLYVWEVHSLGLIPKHVILPQPDVLQRIVHAQCFAHLVLFSLMMVATFIDFDEKTIPDEITVWGTLLALLLVGIFPDALMPTISQRDLGRLLAIDPWPTWLSGLLGLAGISGLFLVWCFALIDKTVTLRRGWRLGLLFIFASIQRRKSWITMLPLLILGEIYLAVIWRIGGPRWESLATSVIGMAFGGAMIWGVRVVGRVALGIEAMGFGDVTLIAMIGAYLGWQSTVIVFFLAPASALVIAVSQWLLTGGHYIAFGPYLCLAALMLITAWDSLWTNWARPVFGLGLLIPEVIVLCVAAMGGMLWLWRLFRENVLHLKY